MQDRRWSAPGYGPGRATSYGRETHRGCAAPSSPAQLSGLRAATESGLGLPVLILIDFSEAANHDGAMSTLLDQAIESVRRLDPARQDEIARVMKLLAGDEEQPPAPLTPEERAAIARSKAETARGEYATDEQVREVWTKYGL
jgi:hypothetical protein